MSHDMTSLTFSPAFRVSICQAEWLWPIANLKSLMPCNRPWTGDFKFKILDERKNYLVVSCVCPSAKCYIGHLGGPGTAGLNSQVSKNQNGVCPSGHLQHIKTERHLNVQKKILKTVEFLVCSAFQSSLLFYLTIFLSAGDSFQDWAPSASSIVTCILFVCVAILLQSTAGWEALFSWIFPCESPRRIPTSVYHCIWATFYVMHCTISSAFSCLKAFWRSDCSVWIVLIVSQQLIPW